MVTCSSHISCVKLLLLLDQLISRSSSSALSLSLLFGVRTDNLKSAACVIAIHHKYYDKKSVQSFSIFAPNFASLFKT